MTTKRRRAPLASSPKTKPNTKTTRLPRLFSRARARAALSSVRALLRPRSPPSPSSTSTTYGVTSPHAPVRARPSVPRRLSSVAALRPAVRPSVDVFRRSRLVDDPPMDAPAPARTRIQFGCGFGRVFERGGARWFSMSSHCCVVINGYGVRSLPLYSRPVRARGDDETVVDENERAASGVKRRNAGKSWVRGKPRRRRGEGRRRMERFRRRTTRRRRSHTLRLVSWVRR